MKNSSGDTKKVTENKTLEHFDNENFDTFLKTLWKYSTEDLSYTMVLITGDVPKRLNESRFLPYFFSNNYYGGLNAWFACKISFF